MLHRLVGVGLAAFLVLGGSAVAQDLRVQRCLSIADIDARVDCLETGVVPESSVASPAAPNPSKQLRPSPSFDCRAARTSIERAICSDTTLSEWDSRLGKLFQEALQQAKDRQALLENQHLWLVQRDASCSSVADTAIWSCVLETTRARVTSLAKAIATVAEATQATQPPDAATGNVQEHPESAADSTPRSPTNPSTSRISQDEHQSAKSDRDASFPILFAACTLSLGTMANLASRRFGAT